MHDDDEAAGDEPPAFSVVRRAGVAVVRGEIDLANVDRFRAVVADPEVAAVDLAGVRFIGVVGVRALLEVRSPVPSDPRHVAIVAASKPVRRLFELCGLASWLPPVD